MRTARAATENMAPSLWVRREGERVPELPLAPLLNDTPKRSLRGRLATRMAALGGANLRPASAGGDAWKISFGSSRPCRTALGGFQADKSSPNTSTAPCVACSKLGRDFCSLVTC